MQGRKTEGEVRDLNTPALADRGFRKPVQSTWENPVDASIGGHLAGERHYSITQIAERWGLSERTVKRMFQDEPGVRLQDVQTMVGSDGCSE